MSVSDDSGLCCFADRRDSTFLSRHLHVSVVLVCVLTDRQRRNNEMYAGEVVYDDDY